MRSLMKSLLTVMAVLSLSPTAALALPPQCSKVCGVDSFCDDTCAMGGRVTDCREFLRGNCMEVLDEAEDASASLMTDDSAPVCSEENPTAELLATAES